MKRVTNSGNQPIEVGSVPTKEKLNDGQYKDHWIMSQEDRDKGFVRPVRMSYQHEKCGGITSMPRKIAETYAAQPEFYGSTFCCNCGGYFPIGVNGEFVWVDTAEKVGS